MNQSLKAVVQFVVVVGLIVTYIVWIDIETPGSAARFAGYLAPVASLIAGLILFKVATREDVYPDTLRERFGTYFERDGLCFLPLAKEENGVCFIHFYFQNRYSKDCVCDVVLEPPQPLFDDSPLQSLRVTIVCPGGASGVLTTPYAVPEEFAETPLEYKIAANTSYPSGTGKMVHFRDGIRVGPNEVSSGAAALAVAGAMTGRIVFSTRARVKIVLPDTTDRPPADLQIECKLTFVPESTVA